MATRISMETAHVVSRMPDEQAIRTLAGAGFDCVDFSFGANDVSWRGADAPAYDPYEAARQIRVLADELGIVFNQSHTPFTTNPQDEERFEITVKCIEISSILGVKQTVVHPLHYLTYKGNEARLKEENMTFFRRLLPYAERCGVRIATENMYQIDRNRGYIVHDVCASPEEFCDYIDEINSPYFVACLDIGHCALVGEDPAAMIRALGHDRLHALHVHDNDYLHDTHTIPGNGKINYAPILEALADIDYDGDYTLEAGNFLDGFETEFIPQGVKFMAERARFQANILDRLRKK